MAEITAQAVNEFRKKTGLGLMECKTLLKEADGDLKKAETLAKEGRQEGREPRRPCRQGRPHRGLHPPRRQVGGDGRAQLRDRLRRPQRRVPPARQGPGRCTSSAANPLYVRREDVPAEVVAEQKRIFLPRSPTSRRHPGEDRQGQARRLVRREVLLDQQFVKDDAKTVRDVILAVNARTGENISVARFARFVVGEARSRRRRPSARLPGRGPAPEERAGPRSDRPSPRSRSPIAHPRDSPMDRPRPRLGPPLFRASCSSSRARASAARARGESAWTR